MIKIFKIFIHDIKIIWKRKSVFIIISSFIVLSCLYAWINIKACWNPYGNLRNLPIAVVNSDGGATFNGKYVNVGDQIVASLKKDTSVGWNFPDEWQANYGLNDCKYYALIEIPQNFSAGLMTLATTNPQRPNIVYKVNQKANAIATKISNSVADEVSQKVKSSFIASVNKEALSTLDTEGVEIKKNKPQILGLSNTMSKANDDLNKISNYLTQAGKSSEGLQKTLTDFKSDLPRIDDALTKLQNVCQSEKNLVTYTNQSLTQTASELNSDVSQIESISQQTQTLLSELKTINNSLDRTDAINIINNLMDFNSSLINLLDGEKAQLQALYNTTHNASVQSAINQLGQLETLAKAETTALSQLKTYIQNGSAQSDINNAIDAASSTVNQISASVISYSNSIYGSVIPILNTNSSVLLTQIDNANNIIGSLKIIQPLLTALSNFTISSSRLSVDQINDLIPKISQLQLQVSQVQDQAKDLNEQNINKVLDIMKMNPNEVSQFISSPVDVKTVNVYNTEVLGLGITPFYTVLSIWVGVLLLASILSVECHEEQYGFKIGYLQEHFGKMLLFIILSQIQAALVATGDILLVGVHPANTGLFYLMASITGLAFTAIIYTLVSLLSTIGKGVAVIIMVFQIAGAGGLYPIQTNPKIFGMLSPLWPFTYAISGFREAVSGPYWPNVYLNIIALIVFIIIFISLCLLKKYFRKGTAFVNSFYRRAGI